jgi:hypothetical protein
MKHSILVRAALVSLSVCGATVLVSNLPARAEIATPNLYPVAWELAFTHGKPQRVVVEVPGEKSPVAYWYMPYTVTNETDREQTFFPFFELIDDAGNVSRSDKLVPPSVFEAIRKREGNKFLENSLKIAGEIRLGEDQARDGVAIWTEPAPEMGAFSIFVGGLSGEHKTVTTTGGKPVILRKTRQLNFLVRGDEVYPGEDEVNSNPAAWVMR